MSRTCWPPSVTTSNQGPSSSRSRPACDWRRSRRAWPTALQSCHRDLFADNVLPTPSGSICVIDWENSGLADPSQELALVVFEFAGADAARAQALVDAYRAAGGPGVVDRPESFSMVIAQLGHIGELSCRRWLDVARPDERDRNEARVDEFLSDGITPELIESILEAVAP